MSKRYGSLLAALVNRLTAPAKPWRRADTRLRVANALVQTHDVATRHGTLRLVTSQPEALEYPRTILDREPETLDWIDGFAPPCTLWDIGANVGAYALYAALRPGISVIAFEPSPASFAALCRNVEANGSGERVQPYCLALSGSTRLGSLNMTATHPGNAYNSFDSTKDCFGRTLDVSFRQATIGFSLDDFRRLFDLAAPDHLKIDVDGLEEEIVAGGAQTLADPGLRSVLIELEEADSERSRRIGAALGRAGFILASRGVSQHPAGQPAVSNAIFVRPAA